MPGVLPTPTDCCSSPCGDSICVTTPLTDALSALFPWVMVSNYGAVGDGVTDDTSAFRAALAVIAAAGTGYLVLSPGKTYKLSTASTYPVMATLTSCNGVGIIGNGSTINVGNYTGTGILFSFKSCTNVRVTDLTFTSTYSTLIGSAGVSWIEVRTSGSNFTFTNLTFNYGAHGIVVRGKFYYTADADTRITNLLYNNIKFSGTYYGMLFQGNGDNVMARGIVGSNTGRLYFPINVQGHDVVLQGSQGGPFADVLMKIYGSTLFYSKLENMRVSYTSQGRYPGSGNEDSGDNVVMMEAGLNDAVAWVPDEFRNIDITINIKHSATDKDQGAFSIRKFDASNAADTTPRGHIFQNIRLRVTAQDVTNVLNQELIIFAWSADDWTGDFINGFYIEDTTLRNCGAILALFMDGRALTTSRASISVSNFFADGNIALINDTNTVPVPFINVTGANMTIGLGAYTFINGATQTIYSGNFITEFNQLNQTGNFRLGSGEFYMGNNKVIHFKDTGGTDQNTLSVTTGDNTLLEGPNDVIMQSHNVASGIKSYIGLTEGTRVSATAVAGQTYLLIQDVDTGLMQRVLVGGAGTGPGGVGRALYFT